MPLKDIFAEKSVGALFLLALVFLLACGKKPTEPSGKPLDEVEPATARIVFLAQDENDTTHVYIIDDNGENLQKLFSHKGRIGDIQVSPQGDGAVFFVDLGDPSPVCNDQLFIISLESKQVLQLTDIPTGICWEPQWVPNSDEICFVFDSYPNGRQLYAIRTDGTGLRRITSDDSISHRLPQVSPNGKKIVFEKRLAPQKIAVIDVDGLNEKIFTDTPSNDQAPQWSSDGEKIVFVDDFKLCVMDISGENYKVLHSSNRGLFPFDVSPQSDVVVFNSYSGIYRINIDGSDLQLLTKNRAQGSPIMWSYNESKIAFIADLDDDDQQDICIIDAGGTNLKQVTPDAINIIDNFSIKVFDWAPLKRSEDRY